MATNTAATSQTHNGNGSTATFAISFSFLENSDIDVKVGGVLKTLGTHYNISSSSVTFTSGNIPPSGTGNIVFTRDTNVSTKKVDFQDGSVLTETDLDNNADQILFSLQEIVNGGISISAATTSAAGSMSAADKTKLDGIAASATNVTNNNQLTNGAGYITSADGGNAATLDNIDSSQFLRSDASDTFTGTSSTLTFADNTHLKFGTGGDLAIHHDGNNTFITQTATGQTFAAFTNGATFRAGINQKDIIKFNTAGSQQNVELYQGGVSATPTKRLETTSTGISVTGNIGVSGTVDGRDLAADGTKLDNIEASADVTDATNVDAAGAVMNSDSTTAGMSFVVDEDNMSSNSATKIPTQQSVKAYVDTEVAGVVDSAPSALNTLNELAAALGDDANFSTTITNSIGTKLPLAGGTMTGNIVMSGSQTVDGRDLSVDGTKLDGIEASADVTDATNVNAAGAVMNSDLDGKGELLVGDGSGDPTALAAGTNGYVLTANSSTATGLEWVAAGAGGDVNQNAFSNIAVSGQTTVAADSATDTLNLAAGSNITITTTAGSDTVTIASTDTNTQLSTEQVQDIVGAMFSGNTETNITATYQDSDGTIDLVSTDTNTTDLASDSSPQLAANLDVQTNQITTSTSNGNIKLNPNGTGFVEILGDGSSADGTIQLNCSQNSHGVKIKSPPHSAGASYTLTLPDNDGNANQVLKTDGSGGLSWVDQTTDTNTQLSNAQVRAAVEAASDSNVFTDADHNKLDGVAASANNYVHPNHSGDVTSSGDGATTIANDAVTTAKIADDAVTADKLANSINTEIAANTAKTSNATHTGEVTGSTALTIADNVVDEANLKVSNSPTDGYVLTAQSGNTGGLTWAAQSGGGGGLSSDAQNNTVGGSNAGDSFSGTDAVSNTLIGKNAGTAITTADECVAIGHDAGSSNTTATGITSIGFEAGKSYTVTGGTFIGHEAGKGLTDGQQNTAIGYSAMASPTNSGTYANTYIGYAAGINHGNGHQNTGIGLYVLKSNAAWSNIAIGNNAGENNTAGTRSTFIGRYAGHSNSAGSYNFCAGYYAGADITTGDSNVCIGDQAGHSGTNNLTEGDNNVLIGRNTAASSATVSNEITFGDSNIATLRCNVQTISSLSDRRDKTDINTLNLGLDFVKSLNPVKFKWETRDGNGKDGSYEAGFIAQDFQQLQKENDADYLKLVMDENPNRLEASYGKLIPVLVKAIQELTIEVETLKSNG